MTNADQLWKISEDMLGIRFELWLLYFLFVSKKSMEAFKDKAI